MASHTFHPDTHTHGLADGCPRCDEHAERPEVGLDAENLWVLRDRMLRGVGPRSKNERRAMTNLAMFDQASRQNV